MSAASGPEKKPSWRGGKPGDVPARPQPAPSWRTPGGSAGGKPPRSAAPGARLDKRSAYRMVGATSLLLLCAALAFILLVYVPGCTQTELIVSTVAEYKSDAILPNDFAGADGRTLLQRTDLMPAGKNQSVHKVDDLRARLAAVPQKTVAVLFLSLHGGTDGRGAYFLLDDADPDQSETRLRSRELADVLKACPSQHKLLLIDASRVDANWRLGLLENRVADALTALVDKENEQYVPGLAILASSSSGERSWSSAELGPDKRGQSVFGHFVSQALEGEADKQRYGSRSRNRRVDVAELYRYVRLNSEHWVRQNRDLAGQHPLLLPPLEELEKRDLLFDVVAVGGGGSAARQPALDEAKSAPGEATKEGSAAPNSPQQLAALWQDYHAACDQRDRLRAPEDKGPPVFHDDPLTWRRLTFQLIRTEAFLRAGEPALARGILDDARQLLDRLRVNPDPFQEWKGTPFLQQNIAQRTVLSIDQRLKLNAGVVTSSPGLPAAQLKQIFTADSAGKHQESDTELARGTRELAENASACPLGTYRWVAGVIDKGDKQRREGEDILFLAQPEQFAKARDLLNAARADYRAAIQFASEIHEAQLLLQRLLVELPDYARWAAARSTRESDHRPRLVEAFRKALIEVDYRLPDERDRLLRLAVDLPGKPARQDLDLWRLFELARLLESLLETPKPGPNESFQAALRNKVAQTRELLQTLENDLHAQAGEFERSAADPQQKFWQETHEILQWPLLRAGLRKPLNERLDFLSERLHKKFLSEPAGEEQIAPVPPVGSERGLWQGLWAVEALSLGTHDVALQQDLWRRWSAVPGLLEADRPKRLAELGDSIAAAWLGKLRAVQSPVKETDDGSETLRLLVRADRTARSLDGHDVQRVTGDRDPSRELRRLHVTELFLNQARRYLDDYYARVSGTGNKHWFEEAAELCLNAADQGKPQLRFVEARLAETRQLLAERRNSRFSVTYDSSLSLASADKRTLNLTPSVRGNLPTGQAAVWVELGNPALVRVNTAGRLPIASRAETGTSVPIELQRVGSVDEKDCQVVNASGHLLFRGHQFIGPRFDVDPCPKQGIVVSYTPPPPTGSVVVHGSDRRQVLFIFDCSWTMGHDDFGKEAKLPNGLPKFATARHCLEDTLKTLRGLERTDGVGLMVFGNRVRRLNSDKEPIVRPGVDPPLPAIAGNPFLDIEMLAPIRPLNAAYFDELKKKLDTLDSWGNTPLLKSLDEACKKFGDRGGATVVVISDGADLVQKELLPGVQDAIQRKQVDVQIVGFAANADDQAVLQGLARDLKGQFHGAPDGNALANKLIQVLNPRRYTVTGVSRRFTQEQELGLPVADLPPGEYRIGFPGRDTVLARIEGGDRLAFDLNPDGLEHRAGLGCQIAALTRGTNPPPLQLCLSERFYVNPGREADLLLSLKLVGDPRDPRIPCVPRPAEILFEIADDKGSGKRYSRDWKLERDQSVPTWRLKVYDWPAGSSARVQAFWKMQRTTPDDDLNWQEKARPLRLKPIDGGEANLLSLVSARYVDRDGKAVVEIKTANEQPVNPGDSLYRELAELRVELAPPGGNRSTFPLDLPVTTQFFPDEGRLLVTFDLRRHAEPGKLRDLNDWVLFFTTRKSRITAAETLEKPLDAGTGL